MKITQQTRRWLAASFPILASLGMQAALACGQAAAHTDFVGDPACTSCHQSQASTYIHTAHHLTSQLPTNVSILGSFQAGKTELIIHPAGDEGALPGLRFRMQHQQNAFSETVISGDGAAAVTQTETIGLVTGSGKRGQTYLYWRGNALFELPVSYWTDGERWINSPGYQNGTADFSRPVPAACLECHASFLQVASTNGANNFFLKESLEVGITCERCHGPGRAHLARYRDHDKASQDAIVNPSKLSRQLQVDLCAYCHNGIKRQPIAPAFSYVAGQPLANYFRPFEIPAAEHPDVHGNQVGLLERSRCFRESADMTCSTCHDVHTGEKAAATYSQKCIACHTWQACKVASSLGERARGNCVNCHMPVEKTDLIVSQTAGEELHASMRNHWIKIYPQAHLP